METPKHLCELIYFTYIKTLQTFRFCKNCYHAKVQKIYFQSWNKLKDKETPVKSDDVSISKQDDSKPTHLQLRGKKQNNSILL